MYFFRLGVATGFCLLITSLAFGLPAPGDQHWAPQFGPAGANGTLYSITATAEKIYVGGLPNAAGNTKANFIAGYDGTNWFALNNGISGNVSATYVFALAHDQQYVYAGGWFTNADGIPAANVARWDGANWSAMDIGLSGIVFALK